MTLEVTILKVLHSTRNEARKLRHYISNCDVYARELSVGTEEMATDWEANWEGELSDIKSRGVTRSDFRKRNEENTRGFPEDEGQYHMTEFDYLFRNRVPLWHLERFSEAEARQIHNLYFIWKNTLKGALQGLLKGKFDYFFREHLRSQYVMGEAELKRDQHIGKNISQAEEQIRKRYPYLGDRLRFITRIGARHSPENHTDIPVTVHNLVDSGELDIKMKDAIREKRSEKEINHFALAITAPNMFHLTEDLVKQMSFEELLDKTKELIVKKEYRASYVEGLI